MTQQPRPDPAPGPEVEELRARVDALTEILMHVIKRPAPPCRDLRELLHGPLGMPLDRATALAAILDGHQP